MQSTKRADIIPILINNAALDRYVLNVLIAGIFSRKVAISIDCGFQFKMYALPALYQDFQSNITPSKVSGLFFIVS